MYIYIASWSQLKKDTTKSANVTYSTTKINHQRIRQRFWFVSDPRWLYPSYTEVDETLISIWKLNHTGFNQETGQ
jgi:hypothetical protein